MMKILLDKLSFVFLVLFFAMITVSFVYVLVQISMGLFLGMPVDIELDW